MVFRQIQRESQASNISPTELLLEEWSVSGHRLPTIGDFLHLLIQVPFYRAADYVSLEILGQTSPPERPLTGPASKVSINFTPSVDISQIPALLNGIEYPETAMVAGERDLQPNNNRNVHRKISPAPKIVFNQTSTIFEQSTADNDEEEGAQALPLPPSGIIASNAVGHISRDTQPMDSIASSNAYLPDGFSFDSMEMPLLSSTINTLFEPIKIDGNSAILDILNSFVIDNLNAGQLGESTEESQSNIPFLSLLVDDPVSPSRRLNEENASDVAMDIQDSQKSIMNNSFSNQNFPVVASLLERIDLSAEIDNGFLQSDQINLQEINRTLTSQQCMPNTMLDHEVSTNLYSSQFECDIPNLSLLQQQTDGQSSNISSEKNEVQEGCQEQVINESIAMDNVSANTSLNHQNSENSSDSHQFSNSSDQFMPHLSKLIDESSQMNVSLASQSPDLSTLLDESSQLNVSLANQSQATRQHNVSDGYFPNISLIQENSEHTLNESKCCIPNLSAFINEEQMTSSSSDNIPVLSLLISD